MPSLHRPATATALLAALAVGLTGLAVSPANAADSPVPAPTVADLSQSDAGQQRWLSVPDSRLVLNPLDRDDPATELQQNSGPELPLSLGYYANDVANKLTDAVTTYRAPSATPGASEGDDTSWTEPFDSTSAWTPKDATVTAVSGVAQIALTSATKNYGNISRTVSIDVDANPLVTIKVAAASATWNLKVQDAGTTGSTDISLTGATDSSATGTFTYDLRKITGWSGTKSVKVTFYVSGAIGATAAVDSISVHSATLTEDFSVLDGSNWTEQGGANSTNASTFTTDGSAATLTLQGTSSNYRRGWFDVDLDNTPYLTIEVSARSGGKWAARIKTDVAGELPGGASYLVLQNDTAEIGTFTYNIKNLLQMTGAHRVGIELYQGAKGEGPDTSTTFDELSFHDITSWLETTDDYTTTWHPQSLDFDARYSTGSITGTDLFHDADSITRLVTPSDMGSTGGGAVVAGSFTGTANLGSGGNVVSITGAGYTYAVAVQSGTLKLYDSTSNLLKGSASELATLTGSGAWGVQTGSSGTYAVGLGFSTATEDPTGSIAVARARAAASVTGAQADVQTWGSFWDDYLSRVPVPQDYSVQGVDALDVTSAEVRLAYYRAWVGLEMNMLPATPETGNEYAMLGTGKPSLWMKGTPGAANVASWDSLLGMQNLVQVDPENAWSSFEGLMQFVDAAGQLGGESLPSRKAQTAWVLYQATGDKAKLESVYDDLTRHLRWESEHLRWINGTGGHNVADERDAEFVASLIFDLQFAEKISTLLGHPADVTEWGALRTSLTTDFETWFFPASGAPVQKVFLNGSSASTTDANMYLYSALSIPDLAADKTQRLLDLLGTEYSTTKQFAGIAPVALKAPDAQLAIYGLLDRGLTDQATVLTNAILRDTVRSGLFAEVYQAATSGVLTDTPIARGVKPSLFGISGFIDAVWLNNGVRSDVGEPTFQRFAGSTGGVSGLSYLGVKYDVDLDGTTARLSGEGVTVKGLPTTVELPTVGAAVTPTPVPPVDGGGDGDGDGDGDGGTTTPPAVTASLAASVGATTYNKAAKVSVTATASKVVPTGTIAVYEGSTLRGAANLSGGRATITLPKTLAAGTHSLKVTFTSASAAVKAPAAKVITLKVAKAAATLKKVTITKGKKGKSKTVVAKGKKATVKVTLKGVGSAKATGKVTLKVGGKKVGVATLKKKGSTTVATVKTKKLKKTGKVTVSYSGSTNLKAKTYTTKVKVKK